MKASTAADDVEQLHILGEEEVPYYLEMQFSDGRWQRNPTPFPTQEAAEEEGRRVQKQFAPDPAMNRATTPGFPDTLQGYRGPQYRIISA